MSVKFLTATAIAISLSLYGQPIHSMPSDSDMAKCAPKVPTEVLKKILHHESGGRALAVGLNSELLQLKKQPKNQRQAEELIRVLDAAGLSYDVGVGQVNSKNLIRWGVNPVAALDVCHNLGLAQKVYMDCASRYKTISKILSCYNTNDPIKGVKNGYVSKVLKGGGESVTATSKLERVGQSNEVKRKSDSEREIGWIDDEDEWIKDDGWLQ